MYIFHHIPYFSMENAVWSYESPMPMSGGYRCCEHGIFLTEELPGPDAPVDQIEAKFTFEPLGWAGDGYGGSVKNQWKNGKKNINILISTRLKAQENHQ